MAKPTASIRLNPPQSCPVNPIFNLLVYLFLLFTYLKRLRFVFSFLFAHQSADQSTTLYHSLINQNHINSFNNYLPIIIYHILDNYLPHHQLSSLSIFNMQFSSITIVSCIFIGLVNAAPQNNHNGRNVLVSRKLAAEVVYVVDCSDEDALCEKVLGCSSSGALTYHGGMVNGIERSQNWAETSCKDACKCVQE